MSLTKLRTKVDVSATKLIASLRRARSPTSPRAGGNNNSNTMPRHRDSDLPPIPPPPTPPKDGSPTSSNDDDEWGDVRYALQATIPSSDSIKPHVIFLARKPTPTYSKLPPLPADADGTPPRSPSPPPKLSRSITTSRIPVSAARTSAARRRAENITIATPEEAEVKRREAQRRREAEERKAAREEAERQARLKAEKETILARHEAEERARKAALDEELRRASEERRKREEMEREREKLEMMVVEEKKRQERERRRLLAEKMMQERAELAQRGSETERQREEARGRQREARQALALQLKAESPRKGVWLTGWVTVQADDCLSWKRRYFELCEERLLLYKDAEVSGVWRAGLCSDKGLTKETEQPIDQVRLSQIARVREVEDGCEELEAIPNSFALELRGGGEPLTMFTQTAEEKVSRS